VIPGLRKVSGSGSEASFSRGVHWIAQVEFVARAPRDGSLQRDRVFRLCREQGSSYPEPRGVERRQEEDREHRRDAEPTHDGDGLGAEEVAPRERHHGEDGRYLFPVRR
jgi:hypothetical protein